MKKLTDEEIVDRMLRLPDWSVTNGFLERTFTFKEFVQSIQFVNQMAVAAESVNHHPDIDIRYNKVIVRLTTHDAGGLTENDFSLAESFDTIV